MTTAEANRHKTDTLRGRYTGLRNTAPEDLAAPSISASLKRLAAPQLETETVLRCPGALRHRGYRVPYTSEATAYVEHIDPKVVLIDGRRLAELMVDSEVGVTTARTYHVKRVDSDYFEGERFVIFSHVRGTSVPPIARVGSHSLQMQPISSVALWRCPMSELRTRMIRDMALRGVSPGTHEAYIAAVVKLAKYYRRAPDQLSNPRPGRVAISRTAN